MAGEARQQHPRAPVVPTVKLDGQWTVPRPCRLGFRKAPHLERERQRELPCSTPPPPPFTYTTNFPSHARLPNNMRACASRCSMLPFILHAIGAHGLRLCESAHCGASSPCRQSMWVKG